MHNPPRNKARLGAAIAAATLLVVGLSALAGCSRKPVLRMNGVTVYERVWDRTLQQLAPQAAYEMQCGQENLTYALFRKRGRHPTQIGVQGCGQRVVYQRHGRRTWQLVAEEVVARPDLHVQPQPQARPPARHQPRPEPGYGNQPAVPPHDHPHTHEDAEEVEEYELPPPVHYPGT